MDILMIILTIIAIIAVVGIIYYFYTIQSFKNFILFESALKKDPSDEKVKEYMERYAHTFIPKNPKVLQSRASVYHVIKQSDKVSYETKKELREFFEKRKISTLTTSKQVQKRLEEKMELENLNDENE